MLFLLLTALTLQQVLGQCAVDCPDNLNGCDYCCTSGTCGGTTLQDHIESCSTEWEIETPTTTDVCKRWQRRCTAKDYCEVNTVPGGTFTQKAVGEKMEYYTTLLGSINGVLIPGGSVSLKDSLYAKVSGIILKYAFEVGARRDYFPVWGTCLGFEMITHLIADDNVTIKCDAENIPLPLNFTSGATTSRMLSDMPADIRNIATSYNVTPNFHFRCLTPQTFSGNKQLSQTLKVLSTNRDKNGTEFVSMFEAVKYPVYGSQWHPEKISFIWDETKHINHSCGAVRLQQYLGNFLVNEARRSRHTFPDPVTEGAALIENYQPVYGGAPTFSLNYYFNLTRPDIQPITGYMCNVVKQVVSYFC